MWRPPVVTVRPTAEVISLDDAKAHLNVEHEDDDDLIRDMLAAALGHVESVTGQRLAAQSLTCSCDSWSDMAALPLAPISEVAALRYFDVNGIERTVETEIYEARLYGLMAEIVIVGRHVWPAVQAGRLITLDAKVGYEPGDAPFEIVAAAKLILGDLYANRESGQVGSVSSEIRVAATVDALLTNHRRHLI